MNNLLMRAGKYRRKHIPKPLEDAGFSWN